MNESRFYEEESPLFQIKKERGQIDAKDVILKINSFSFGDTLAATPTLRKLAQSYGKKIIVCTSKPFLFDNNPHVLFTINLNDFNKKDYIGKPDKYEIFNTFNSIGRPDKNGIESKYGLYDIRRIHCVEIGFDLRPDEMHTDYYPGSVKFEKDDQDFINNKQYVVIHIGKNWPSRTWPEESYKNLIKGLNENGYSVVLVGFDQSAEPGKYKHDKSCYNFNGLEFDGISFLNRTSLDQDYYITKNSEACITLDTGQLHLAGCTETYIIQIGASINPIWRAPYRHGTQNYKYKFIGGTCASFCASDPKYSVIEHGTINSVPPLPYCLEGRPNYDCQPRWENVLKATLEVIK